MVHEDYVTDLERTGDALATSASKIKNGESLSQKDFIAFKDAIALFRAVRSEARGYGRF